MSSSPSDGKIPWFDKPAVLFAALVLFPPLGLFALWKTTRFGKAPKGIITLAAAVWGIFLWSVGGGEAAPQLASPQEINEKLPFLSECTQVEKAVSNELQHKWTNVIFNSSVDERTVYLADDGFDGTWDLLIVGGDVLIDSPEKFHLNLSQQLEIIKVAIHQEGSSDLDDVVIDLLEDMIANSGYSESTRIGEYSISVRVPTNQRGQTRSVEFYVSVAK